MYFITTSPLGLFATDDQKNELAHIYFSKDPKTAKKQYQTSLKPELSEEEKQLTKNLKTKDITFEIKKDEYPHQIPNPAGEYVRSTLFKLASKNNFSQPDFSTFLYHFNFELTKDTMQSQSVNDKLIIQAVSAIDDLDKTINLMCMRLREWYSLYFPEASEKLKDNEKFAKYISDTLYRTELNNIDIEETIGTDLKPDDLEQNKQFAQTIHTLFAERKTLEKYIEKKCKEVIPNMTAIIGAEQASRILAHAGSTEKLAKFPSSTIQILGAEKALFRYLHNVGTSPKHGLIFNTSYIQRAPRDARGKIARILASKLSIASKIDHYKGDFAGSRLKEDMDKAMTQALSARPKKDKKQAKPNQFAPKDDRFKIQKEDRFSKQDRFKKDDKVKSQKEDRFSKQDKFKKRNYDDFKKQDKYKKDDKVKIQKEDRFSNQDQFKNKKHKNRATNPKFSSPGNKESTIPKSGGFEQYLEARSNQTAKSQRKPKRQDRFKKEDKFKKHIKKKHRH